jgi:hypothetical protein
MVGRRRDVRSEAGPFGHGDRCVCLDFPGRRRQTLGGAGAWSRAVGRPCRPRVALLGFTGGVGMTKASESKELIRAWASGMKQWLRWIAGEAPVPDKRSKQILGGTVGAVLLLVVAVSLLPGGGNPPAKQAANRAHAAYLTQQQATERAALLRAHRASHPPPTTTTTTTAPITRRGSGSHAGRGGGARRSRDTTTSHT